jgi:hypothetical protein
MRLRSAVPRVHNGAHRAPQRNPHTHENPHKKYMSINWFFSILFYITCIQIELERKQLLLQIYLVLVEVGVLI